MAGAIVGTLVSFEGTVSIKVGVVVVSGANPAVGACTVNGLSVGIAAGVLCALQATVISTNGKIHRNLAFRSMIQTFRSSSAYRNQHPHRVICLIRTRDSLQRSSR